MHNEVIVALKEPSQFDPSIPGLISYATHEVEAQPKAIIEKQDLSIEAI